MNPEYADDTEGIRKIYDYISLKATENKGQLDEIDVSYVMGALNMWLIDHEALNIPESDGNTMTDIFPKKTKGWFK